MTGGEFRILSLSGGGFRGLFTAKVLAMLEERASNQSGEHKPIGRCFDLICGTSIGGILALAIGLEKPMAKIVAMMEERGADVFPRSRWRQGWFWAKYGNRALQALVDDIFGGNEMDDSRHRLLVPAVNYSAGAPQFFKTSHCENFVASDYKMRDVAMATSAAPTYFPAYKLKKTDTLYVDGGLFGNNPSLFGMMEAVCYLGRDMPDVHLLSIGTMGGTCRADASKSANMGILCWNKNLFDLTIDTQEEVVAVMARRQLPNRYHRINVQPTAVQEENTGLDVADKAAIETLKSMADRQARIFMGLPEADKWLGYSADKFVPYNTPRGKSNEKNR